MMTPQMRANVGMHEDANCQRQGVASYLSAVVHHACVRREGLTRSGDDQVCGVSEENAQGIKDLPIHDKRPYK
jgi:hypothetical protein